MTGAVEVALEGLEVRFQELLHFAERSRQGIAPRMGARGMDTLRFSLNSNRIPATTLIQLRPQGI